MDTELQAALDALATNANAFQAAYDDRLDRLEMKLNRPGLGGEPTGRKSQSYKTFESFIRRGPESLEPSERRALVVGDDSKGGYLAPPEFIVEVLRNVVQFSPVRQAARVGQTTAGNVLIPKRTGTLTASWLGEIETQSGVEPTYGLLDIPVSGARCHVDCSNSLLDDAAVDMGAELAFDLGEEFGRLEGAAFLNGDGVKKPLGIMSDTNVAYTPSGASTALTADGFIDTFYALAPFYRSRATWMLNGTSLANIRKAKTGDGQYIWMPGFGAQPETILGRPVVEAVDMPDVAANAYPVLFGDFQQGYRIYDRLQLSILRDPYSIATTGQTRFHARRRVGGGVAKAEAFRKMKIAVS
jgi:HK97 family phage major capsid protein